MGAQWKHAGRVANSSKRGALISKLTKEIMVAARGGANPEMNYKLRTAVEAAKKASVPRDNIDRAIKKGAGLDDNPVIFESVFYEGFAPHRVPVIVECLTENRNRTASDIRVLFRKGQLGNQGAVSYLFDRLGVVEGTHTDTSLDLEAVAIEAGAQNVEPLEKEEVPAGQIGIRCFCDPVDLDTVTKYLAQNGWSVSASEVSFIAKSPVQLPADQKAEVEQFLSDIDDNDDVKRIFTALG